MKVEKRERLPGRPGRLQELHPQAGNACKILIEGNDGQIAFQGGGGNERVHIPDEVWAMERQGGRPLRSV